MRARHRTDAGPEDQEDAEGDGQHDEFLDAETETDDGEHAGAGGEEESRNETTGRDRAGPGVSG